MSAPINGRMPRDISPSDICGATPFYNKQIHANRWRYETDFDHRHHQDSEPDRIVSQAGHQSMRRHYRQQNNGQRIHETTQHNIENQQGKDNRTGRKLGLGNPVKQCFGQL